MLPDGTPSGILADRPDDGIALYFAGVAPKIIMSGDNGTASYNEVKAMKQYAIAQRRAQPGHLLRPCGFLHVREHVSGEIRIRVRDGIVVATQTYHLYRALWSAKSLGMQAEGVPSDYHEYQKQLQYDIREIPARTKDFFQGALPRAVNVCRRSDRP